MREQGTNVIGFGEMGIANTSAAACLMSRLTGLPLADCAGRGTGLDEAGVARKREILERALARHAEVTAPLDVLATFGGYEIAAMTGAYLAAAACRMVILVDGFIASAALLVAARIDPTVLQYCVFSHCSDERGHKALLAEFGAEPLLALNLRLGEGTGAALAWPLVASAAAFLKEMATFSGAGVSCRRGLIGSPPKDPTMADELRFFLTALGYFTRVPLPQRLAGWVGFQPHFLNAAARYFPLVGLLVGVAGALVTWGRAGLVERARGGGAGHDRHAAADRRVP